MSSRQLRKLQQQRELEAAKARQDALVQEESEEEEDIPMPAKKGNAFSSFALLEDNDDEESAEEDLEPENESPIEEIVPVKAAAPSKSKKSKKKKKKTKAAKSEKAKADPTEAHEDEDEIDAALRALNLKNRGSASANTDQDTAVDAEYEKVCSLLGINSQHLKVGNEMRNLFGKQSIENNEDAGGRVGRGARRRGAHQQVDLETALKGHHPPGKGLPEVTLRRNIFIQGRDDWPKAATGGLTMEIVDDQRKTDGTVEFRYVHSQAYNALQQQFNMFVEMGNPQNLIGLLQRNPYHISLLLQVSKIAKDQSDHALSSDLIERALFTFARASLTLFSTKLAEGKARLDFARPENRELWLAGYHYIKSLMMKGTYRTALEWAKLLLALDPEDDPYCMRLLIHQLALKAHENQYLLDLANTSLYINIFGESTRHCMPSLAFAAMQMKDGVKSRYYLEKSIQQVPWLFTKLFQELNLDSPPPSIWGALPRTDAETLFTDLYVRQTKDLWNTPEATSLLMEVAYATDKLDESKISKVENNEITLDVARAIYLDNTPALMALVPSVLLHRKNNSDSDPLPPDHNIFSWPSQRAAFRDAQTPADGFADDYMNPLAALARLLPGLRRNNNGEGGEELVVDDDLRRQLEAAAAAADEEEANMDTDEAQNDGEGGRDRAQRGWLDPRNLLEVLFGERDEQPSNEEDETTSSDDEFHDAQDDIDGGSEAYHDAHHDAPA